MVKEISFGAYTLIAQFRDQIPALLLSSHRASAFPPIHEEQHSLSVIRIKGAGGGGAWRTAPHQRQGGGNFQEEETSKLHLKEHKAFSMSPTGMFPGQNTDLSGHSTE